MNAPENCLPVVHPDSPAWHIAGSALYLAMNDSSYINCNNLIGTGYLCPFGLVPAILI